MSKTSPKNENITTLTIFERVDRKSRRKRQIRITAESVTIGSSEHCDLQLAKLSDPILVEIKYAFGQWWVINPHRSRKIRVNAKSIDLEKNLEHQDQILIDEHLICFENSQQERQKKKLEHPFAPQPATDDALWNYLIEEEDYDEILVNGANEIFVDYQGQLIKSPWSFSSHDFLKTKIITEAKQDQTEGYYSWNKNDSVRVNALLKPLVEFPHICFRKAKKHVFTLAQLEEQGFGTAEEIEFLREALLSKQSILISGGTSTGKTVLLRSLVESIKADERLLILEEEKELQWPHAHHVHLETGRGGLQKAVIESLRLRPDRIIISELRGGEAFEFLQAINTGHPGSMSTIHANSPREALFRLENLLYLNHYNIGEELVRRQVSTALDIIVQLTRSEDGKRKISSIQRLSGLQNSVYLLSDPIGQETSGLHLKSVESVSSKKPSGDV